MQNFYPLSALIRKVAASRAEGPLHPSLGHRPRFKGGARFRAESPLYG